MARVESFLIALLCYCGTSLIAFLGLELSPLLVRQISYVDLAGSAGFAAWDGVWYREIARSGYWYDPQRPSSVAFFPAFPMAGRFLSALTGWSAEASLMVVANLALAGAFLALYAYAARRRDVPKDPIAENKSAQERLGNANRDAPLLVLVAFGFWPCTVFYRMAYSESLFLFLAILSMYGMQRGVQPLWIALTVGLATATRPVGVALLGPFVLWLWERALERKQGMSGFLCSTAIWVPLACWGIVSFMVFQYVQFGDPLAFVSAHQLWAKRSPTSYGEQWLRALLLEPIWSVYVPSSPAWWVRLDVIRNPFLSLPFANPIYFCVSVALVWIGWRNRWLDRKEVLLAALLLGIPYLTHSYRHLMLSQGRFAAVAFPIYLVMGRLMQRAPTAVGAVCCALAGALLAIYAALFAAWYRVT